LTSLLLAVLPVPVSLVADASRTVFAVAWITSITKLGCDSIGTWVLSTARMIAPIRFARNVADSPESTVFVSHDVPDRLRLRATPGAFRLNRGLVVARLDMPPRPAITTPTM